VRRAEGTFVVSTAALALTGAAGCWFDPLDPCGPARPGEARGCPMPGWMDRAFDLRVPAAWDGASPLPVVYVVHGGGGNRRAAAGITCADGDVGRPDCLPAKAAAAGYAVVLPDGAGMRPLRDVRTWNAGGGRDGWLCVSGASCRAGYDDVGYFDALHAEVVRILPVDPRRVYVTGMSNGGAMSHRLACEWGVRLAAAAPVGGGNQHAAAGGTCAGGVPVLQIHGTEDPCWTFEESAATCAGLEGGRKVGVAPTLEGWRVRNGCGAVAAEEPIPDRDPADGTTSTHVRYPGCAAAVELVRVDGGGHTWPGGRQYFGTDVVGRTARDFDADDLILGFFDAHTAP
jgi:polyhydroxybutyrate depolymerase